MRCAKKSGVVPILAACALLSLVGLVLAGWCRAASDVGSGPPSQGSDDLRDRIRAKMKEPYRFAEWGGKVKRPGLVGALDLDPNDFADLLGVDPAPVPRLAKEELQLRARRPNESAHIRGQIYRSESALAAHLAILDYFGACSAMPPVFKRVTQGPLADVGDVCFVPVRDWIPKGQDAPVLGIVAFARNNVYVSLHQHVEGKQAPWDLVALAKRIDARLLDALPKEEAGTPQPASGGETPKPPPSGG